MVDIKKFNDTDLYGLLGVGIDADEKQIRKAYRKAALTCHPDKNPDNPRAAELFHNLSEALEVLTDESARCAYNRILNAKKAAAIRHQQLDSKRKKLIEDLNRREQEANSAAARRQTYSTETKSPEEQLAEEIKRLRKEGSRLLAEEQELLQKQLREERVKMSNGAPKEWDSSQHRIKIKWKAEKRDADNGGYSEPVLRKFLQKYGEIVALVLSPKKRGSALVEFKTQDAGEMAIAYEKGDLNNPLTLTWIGETPKDNKRFPTESSTVTETDFESLVLREMRQAEERKRLIEQMMAEDGE